MPLTLGALTTSSDNLAQARKAVADLAAGARTNAARMDAAAKTLKEQRHASTPLDDLEKKAMASTALAAAAAGSPAQAKAMLAKVRARAMEAAAAGADTAELESLARELARLAKVAEKNDQREKHGGADHSAAAIPGLTAIATA